MRPRLSSLAGRLRGIGRAKLWAALALSIAINVGAVVYAAAYMPIVRLQPTCWDENSWLDPIAEVDGELDGKFQTVLEQTLSFYGVAYYSRGSRIYVRLSDWLDRDYMMNMSNKATYKTLHQRPDGASGIAAFAEADPGRWPPCDGVRALAIQGGT